MSMGHEKLSVKKDQLAQVFRAFPYCSEDLCTLDFPLLGSQSHFLGFGASMFFLLFLGIIQVPSL
jgi:hypothetical protein